MFIALGLGVLLVLTKKSTPASSLLTTNAPVPADGPVAYLPPAAPISNVVVSQSIDPAQLAIVRQWFDSLDAANKNQAYAQLPNMTSTDIAGLVDLIDNAWGSGIDKTTDSERAFWNAWRLKYHILDGTYA